MNKLKRDISLSLLNTISLDTTALFSLVFFTQYTVAKNTLATKSKESTKLDSTVLPT
jgi:ABC-type nickel/cobalt efflux system permease component RcnA